MLRDRLLSSAVGNVKSSEYGDDPAMILKLPRGWQTLKVMFAFTVYAILTY